MHGSHWKQLKLVYSACDIQIVKVEMGKTFIARGHEIGFTRALCLTVPGS